MFVITPCFFGGAGVLRGVWGVYVAERVSESETGADKERESLCEEFGKLNKVPQESLPKDLGECSRL